MSCSACSTEIKKLGANPVNIQWNVVRGDTAKLKIEFLYNDETTHFNTTGWTYLATAYNPVTDSTNTLNASMSSNVLTITATPQQTATWGTNAGNIVAQLNFDIQATIPGSPNQIWTPVVGTICVTGDITGASL